MKSFFSILLVFNFAFAYIPPLKMILDRTAENAGSGIYTIDSDVTFSDGNEEATVKEVWFVENERTLKLQVTGLKELKGLRLQYLYINDQKISLKGTQKENQPIPADFLEKWHHFRNGDSLGAFLEKQKILAEFKKGEKSSRAIYESNHLALSRSQGVINYAIGDYKKETIQPRVWIEQDLFLLRKVRFPGSYEIDFNNFKTYSKGLHYPKEKTITWGTNKVVISTLSVSSKSSTASSSVFSLSSLELPNQSEVLYAHPLKSMVEEFYTRFR